MVKSVLVTPTVKAASLRRWDVVYHQITAGFHDIYNTPGRTVRVKQATLSGHASSSSAAWKSSHGGGKPGKRRSPAADEWYRLGEMRRWKKMFHSPCTGDDDTSLHCLRAREMRRNSKRPSVVADALVAAAGVGATGAAGGEGWKKTIQYDLGHSYRRKGDDDPSYAGEEATSTKSTPPLAEMELGGLRGKME